MVVEHGIVTGVLEVPGVVGELGLDAPSEGASLAEMSVYHDEEPTDVCGFEVSNVSPAMASFIVGPMSARARDRDDWWRATTSTDDERATAVLSSTAMVGGAAVTVLATWSVTSLVTWPIGSGVIIRLTGIARLTAGSWPETWLPTDVTDLSTVGTGSRRHQPSRPLS